MAIWRAFIDDSGSDGSLFYPDMTPKPIQKMDGTEEEKGAISKVSAAGMVIVRGSDMAAVQREVMGLRWDIKRKYKLPGDAPPRLHMRHLWGETANFDKGRNPFYGLSAQERLVIANKAYHLVDALGKRYSVYFAAQGSDNAVVQSHWGVFFNSERSRIDREIIYSRFRPAKNAKRFYARITNPSMSLVSGLVTDFTDFINLGSHTGVICYDTSDASKGFEADEVYDAIASFRWCDRLVHSSHGAENDECLLQLADLASFAVFRQNLNSVRGLEPHGDAGFARAIGGAHFEFLPKAEKQNRHLSIGIHYLAARQFLLGIDREWVGQHLKTPEDLVVEFDAGASKEAGGIHIVKQPSYEHYLSHGRLP